MNMRQIQNSQLLIYILFFCILLLGPVLLDHFASESAVKFYSTIKRSDVRYVGEFLKNAPENAEIVFVGTSDTKSSFQTTTLKDYWAQQGQKKTNIYNLSSPIDNPVYLFSLVDTLMQHKKIKLLAVELTNWNNQTDWLYAFQFYWWKSPGLRWALSQAPFIDQVRYYAESVMGLPWRIWVDLRPDFPTIPDENEGYEVAVKNDGALYLEETKTYGTPQHYIELSPPKRKWQDYISYVGQTVPPHIHPKFLLTPMQRLLLLYIKEICKKNGTKLIFTLPGETTLFNNFVAAPTNIPEELTGTPIVTAPDSWLYRPEEINLWQKSKTDSTHRNRSGRDLYTKAMASALYHLAYPENEANSETE